MSNYLNVNAHPTSCLSPSAGILGDVTIGAQSSVFNCAQIRGDAAPIWIGKQVNIQENVTIHVDKGFPCNIADGCTIGHNAVVHGCSLDENVLVGAGAIILDGVHIGEESIVAAGAIVTQNKQFPRRSMIMGQPAKVTREITDGEAARMCVKPRMEYVFTSQEMADEGVMCHPNSNYCGQVGIAR